MYSLAVSYSVAGGCGLQHAVLQAVLAVVTCKALQMWHAMAGVQVDYAGNDIGSPLDVYVYVCYSRHSSYGNYVVATDGYE